MKKEKSYSAQTVRLPKVMEKPLGHLMVDSGESFQSLVLRLLSKELTTEPKPLSESDEMLIATRWALATQDMNSTEFLPLRAQLQGAVRAYRKAQVSDQDVGGASGAEAGEHSANHRRKTGT